MGTKILSIEVSDELYQRFINVIGTQWKSKHESYAKAYQDALEVALIKFLDDYEKGINQNKG